MQKKKKKKEGTDTVLTSQETRHASAAEPSRPMLFGETVAGFVRTPRSTQVHSEWAGCEVLCVEAVE
jgi:hypothetical protein